MAIAVPTRNKTAQLLVIGGETVHDEADTSAFFVNIASGVITDNPALTEKYVPSPCAAFAAGFQHGLGVRRIQPGLYHASQRPGVRHRDRRQKKNSIGVLLIRRAVVFA